MLEYGAEFVETLWLVFWVVVFVAWMFAPDSPLPRLLPSKALRLFLTGILLGAVSWLAALTPPGKLSGAHLNPAISLGFWLLDKMHHKDLVGYVSAQLLGGLGGAWLARLAIPRLGSQVQFAALQPGDGATPLAAFGAEIAATCGLAFVVYTFVSHERLKRWTAFAAMVAVGILVWVDGSFSGAGMNPARWLGPAAVVDGWGSFWIYAIGPLPGAVAAVALRRWGGVVGRVPHTAKRVHDPRYRSIFKNDRAPSTAPTAAR